LKKLREELQEPKVDDYLLELSRHSKSSLRVASHHDRSTPNINLALLESSSKKSGGIGDYLDAPLKQQIDNSLLPSEYFSKGTEHTLETPYGGPFGSILNQVNEQGSLRKPNRMLSH